MRRNSVNSASGLKTALTIVFSDHDFFIKGLKLWRFDNTVNEFWAYFHAHAQKQLFRNFRSKIWPRHSLRRPRFPIRQMHFHYRVTCTGYIRCFCATTSHDHFHLDLWPFDLESISCTALLMFDPHTNFYYPMTSATELRVLNIWSHFRYLKQSLRMRRVTWPLTGGKNSPRFRNPSPQFTYSICHFQGATMKIKPRYRQKIAFSHYEGYKVYCACAVSRDLCIGGPPKPHVTIFWPRIVYSLYNFYAATMTIKGSLY